MNLDAGIGIGEDHEWTPVIHAEVCIDLYRPLERLSVSFIQCDIQNLPFRDKSFTVGYAYNVIEHIQNPWKGMNEMIRVSKTVRFRQDNFLHFGNYLEDSHLWLQLPNLKFLKYPRTRIGIILCNHFRKIWDSKSRTNPIPKPRLVLESAILYP